MRVRKARNDAYHHRVVEGRTEVVSAAERFVDLLNIHLGDREAGIQGVVLFTAGVRSGEAAGARLVVGCRGGRDASRDCSKFCFEAVAILALGPCRAHLAGAVSSDVKIRLALLPVIGVSRRAHSITS